MSERVCRLGIGSTPLETRLIWSEPGYQISPRFRPNDGVLRRKMRWLFVLVVFVHCLWDFGYGKYVSERV